MDQTTLRYDHLIEKHLEHLKCKYRHLLIDDATFPQFWFLTVNSCLLKRSEMTTVPIPPHRCFVLFERFYVRLLSRLMNNCERKRSLQPLTFLYIDYPLTKREKTFATLSPIEQFRANQFHFYPEHPETTPHIHAIMLVAPQLVERFEAIRPSLANLFQSFWSCKLHVAYRPLADP